MEGSSRRDFLKKAGVAAWTVPAVQVVNMTGALAGTVNGSVTTSTRPPTTPPPPCIKEVCYYVKWDVGQQAWESSPGQNHCLVDAECESANGGLFATASGDGESVTVTIKDGVECDIYKAYHKEATDCVEASHGDKSVTFVSEEHGISHVELFLVCCPEVD